MFIVMGARVAVASQLCKCQSFWSGKTHQQSWLATMWWKICRLRRGYIAVNCLMVEERNRDCSKSAKSWCYKLQAITIDIGAWETGVFTRQNSKNQREHRIIRGEKTAAKSCRLWIKISDTQLYPSTDFPMCLFDESQSIRHITTSDVDWIWLDDVDWTQSFSHVKICCDVFF